jgi:hypothetical protein
MYKTRLFIYFIIYKYILLVTKVLLKCRNLVILQHSIKSCERKYLFVCVCVCVCVCMGLKYLTKKNEMFSYKSFKIAVIFVLNVNRRNKNLRASTASPKFETFYPSVRVQCCAHVPTQLIIEEEVRVSGYRYRGLGFDSRRYQIF